MKYFKNWVILGMVIALTITGASAVSAQGTDVTDNDRHQCVDTTTKFYYEPGDEGYEECVEQFGTSASEDTVDAEVKEEPTNTATANVTGEWNLVSTDKQQFCVKGEASEGIKAQINSTSEEAQDGEKVITTKFEECSMVEHNVYRKSSLTFEVTE